MRLRRRIFGAVIGALPLSCAALVSFDEYGYGKRPSLPPAVVTGDGDVDSAAADAAPAPTYIIGGSLVGLASNGGRNVVVLQNNADAIDVSNNGAFNFPVKIASGGAFNVSVKTQPRSPIQKCTVSGGTGFVVAGNVTSIVVNCITTEHTIGGSVAGLRGTLIVTNNGNDDLVLNNVGQFAFAKTVESGSAYDVKVKTGPQVPSQTCTVAGGAGTVGSSDVTSVSIGCTTNAFDISGSVAGLGAGKAVVLQNNGGDDLSVDSSGPFTFSTAVESGAGYAVTVRSAPAGQACVVTRSVGTVGTGAVTDVAVVCTSNVPNCVGLDPICGPTLTGDCCDSTMVPGGTFSRSYDGVSAGATDPGFVATVSSFRLDTYEVTVGRFRAFVAAYPASAPALGAGKDANNAADPGWNDAWNITTLAPSQNALISGIKSCGAGTTWTDGAAGPVGESKAMGCISWHEAFAFCIWDGGRLPTEAEWNYAAAGGNEQRVYPWSSPPSSTAIDSSYAIYDNAPSWGTVGASPKGTSRWGQADMAGNVWEWTLDWAKTPYSITPCNDCANFIDTGMHVARGGGINNPASLVLTSERGVAPLGPAGRAFDIGVRCARTP